MKIAEITLRHQLGKIQNSTFLKDEFRQLKAILTKYGWKSLGTGAEAAVAIHPNKSYVLKIFREDSKYQDFVKFVEQHHSNPHLPKFSRYVRQVPGLPYLYVRMEKLMRVPEAQLSSTYLSYVLSMYAMGNLYDIDMLGGGLDDMVQYKVKDLGFDASDIMDDETREQIYERVGGAPPETWTQVLANLAEFSKGMDLQIWDMHQGNFLRRGKTLVIADPFY